MQFVPRVIDADMRAKGYNNEGRGELLGYIAVPKQHHPDCAYRISTGGDPDKQPHEACNCKIGLWQEVPPAQKVVNDMRKTSKRTKKAPTKKVTVKKSKKRAKK